MEPLKNTETWCLMPLGTVASIVNNVDSTLENFMNLLLFCTESAIPHYETSIRPGDKEFMNSDICKTIRQRDRLKKAWKQSNDEIIHTEFCKCKNLVLSMCQKADENTKNKLNSEIVQTNTSVKE